MSGKQEEQKKVQYIVNLFIQTPYPLEFYLFLWQIDFFLSVEDEYNTLHLSVLAIKILFLWLSTLILVPKTASQGAIIKFDQRRSLAPYVGSKALSFTNFASGAYISKPPPSPPIALLLLLLLLSSSSSSSSPGRPFFLLPPLPKFHVRLKFTLRPPRRKSWWIS